MEHYKKLPSYEDKIRSDFIHLFRKNFLALGSGVTMASTIVDYLLAPDYIVPIFLFRFLSVPVAFLSWYSFRLKFFSEKNYTWPAYFTCIYFGILHWYLFMHTGRDSSPYIIGLSLASISMIATLPWKKKNIPLVLILLWLPIFVQTLLLSKELNSAHIWAVFSMILIAITLSIRLYQNAEKLRAQEFHYRMELEHINQNQTEIITKKTEEATYLEKLASQFSPQVIEMIKTGTLSLESKTRQEVAVIFVDVEKSTGRSLRIDHQNYSTLMSHFFSECVEVFLKNDVTLGTYQGDGIMAITNAPKVDAKFREHAVQSCLEILDLHNKFKGYYLEKWRSEFNIRIGISTGWATVGFFPSKSHGTYTAIGDTVNLSARLCSLASVNSIATTKEFLTQLNLENNVCVVRKHKTIENIRGFEGEKIEIFDLQNKSIQVIAEDICLTCSLALVISSSQIGAEFMKCPKCNYRKIIEKNAA